VCGEERLDNEGNDVRRGSGRNQLDITGFYALRRVGRRSAPLPPASPHRTLCRLARATRISARLPRIIAHLRLCVPALHSRIRCGVTATRGRACQRRVNST
jgi:hypothetical protein